jgi:NAD(P)-dependent dehydrogenase (short-subunit alcohol dehydrogenase family)
MTANAEFIRHYDFTGRTFVVTGGTGVLGKSLVAAIAGCGANVALIGRSDERLRAVVSSLGTTAGRCAAFRADVLDAAALREAAAGVVKEFGRVDGLLNGAGGNDPGATTGPDRKFFDLPEEALRRVFDLNLTGTILPSQVFGALMAEAKAGVILNVTSMAAVRPLTRIAGYAAAKAAVSNFTQWLAVHMAQEYSPAIRVNAIAPGFFLTEQNRFLLTDKGTGKLTPRGDAILRHTPMGRFGEPGDLAGAALWLLSPASSFVTGVVLPVDGGFSAYPGV